MIFFSKKVSEKWMYNALYSLQVHTLSQAELITVINSVTISNIKQTWESSIVLEVLPVRKQEATRDNHTITASCL